MIEEALKDANTLWAILTSVEATRILGPWKSRKPSPGMCRPLPSGKEFISVYKSMRRAKPEFYEFVTEYDEDGEVRYADDELFDDAVKAWEADKLLWKPWTYALDYSLEGSRIRYADSLEEAMALADVEMGKRGWLLAELPR